jgi:hypothetical protein
MKAEIRHPARRLSSVVLAASIGVIIRRSEQGNLYSGLSASQRVGIAWNLGTNNCAGRLPLKEGRHRHHCGRCL